MGRSLACRSLSLFVFLLVLDGLAIFFFTGGFLLTRTELTLFSNCSDIAQCPSSCFDHPLALLDPKHVGAKGSNFENIREESRVDGGELETNGPSSDDKDQQCWTKPAVKRVIILIIDALRFDFVAPSRNFAGERKPWMDKLQVLRRNVEDKNRVARMFKFIADPPTTTLQRLKGLTTGGLPTFIDIGHSFGAPAIVEDNLILQLARTGKKVIMMGDDTWMQLFPTQFVEAYPFPSFNVKDLHTVDDGVIRELFPALLRNDWDVLIGHFLGVDHVGHIYGVESPLMPEKLEQYNKVIEDVLGLLLNMSEPGGLFEDTLMIVMGDHGQTLNGDHGGGTPEEVETALFALGTNDLSSALPNAFPSSCDLKDPVLGCINTFSQLDFSATLAALLGVPFPFGSVGHVNADLYTLFAGKTVSVAASPHQEKEGPQSPLKLLNQYLEVLCVNSWQVRRYFEVYSKVAITGFPPQDLAHLEGLYTKAHLVSDEIESLMNRWMSAKSAEAREEVTSKAISAVREQIDAYGMYLSASASLARSQWTQFSIGWMVVGFSLLLTCVATRALALHKLYATNSLRSEKHSTPVKKTVKESNYLQEIPQNRKRGGGHLSTILASSLLVALHLFSLFSNSYIVAEGLVIYFLIASSGLLYLRSAIQAHSKILQAVGFLALIWIMPKIHTLSIFKGVVAGSGQGVSKGVIPDWLRQILLTSSTIILPLSVLSGLPNLKSDRSLLWRLVNIGVTATNGLIGLHWLVVDLSSTEVLSVSDALMQLIRLQLPRLVYAISLLLVLSAGILSKASKKGDENKLNSREVVGLETTAMLAGASGTIILLMGRKGPLLTLLIVLEVWLFLELQGVTSSRRRENNKSDSGDVVTEMKSSFRATANWSLIAAQLFFCTGHRSINATLSVTGKSNSVCCAFDGLHYSAAFIGFDDFGFFQQGVLLATETFGASHFLPVIGLPLLALRGSSAPHGQEIKDTPIILEITKGYLWFGLLKALVTSITTASVGIQRRHLMVWGIFAPKYVFDAVGLLLVDIFIILSASVFFRRQKIELHKRE